MARRGSGRQRYSVAVEFECDVPLKQAEIREYVETALRSEVGAYSVESPIRDIDRKSIKAIPRERSHRPRTTELEEK